MTATPPDAPVGPPPTDGGPRTSREELRDLGRIRRTVGPDRKIAGVAGGLARHLDIDPIILRVAFVVLVFFGGAGLLLYGACWLLLPEDHSPSAPLSLDDRNRGIALLVVGAISVLLVLGDSIGRFDFPWPLVFVALAALVVLIYLDRDKQPRPTAPPVPHAVDPATGQFVPASPGASYQPPVSYRPPPRNPRRRGPVLFWWTMLLAAIGVSTLGVLDLAGASVADPAYPAVVLGTCGVMLLVSAFWGRGGGLIFVGLVSAVAMALASLSTTVEGGDITSTPLTAAGVDSYSRTGAGEIVVDLTQVTDLDNLDGRTLTLRVRAGRIEVILPPGLSAQVDAGVNGAGHVELFDDERGGFDIDDTGRLDAGVGTPEVTIDAQVYFGEIQVHTEAQR